MESHKKVCQAVDSLLRVLSKNMVGQRDFERIVRAELDTHEKAVRETMRAFSDTQIELRKQMSVSAEMARKDISQLSEKISKLSFVGLAPTLEPSKSIPVLSSGGVGAQPPPATRKPAADGARPRTNAAPLLDVFRQVTGWQGDTANGDLDALIEAFELARSERPQEASAALVEWLQRFTQTTEVGEAGSPTDFLRFVATGGAPTAAR